MEVVGYAFKAEQLPGDAPELRGTELGHAAVYLDALAYVSGNMSMPTAFAEGGKAMIHAHRDLFKTATKTEIPDITPVMLRRVESAVEFADLQLTAWTDVTQDTPLQVGSPAIQSILREYRSHVRALSVAMQRVLATVEPSAGGVMSPNTDIAVKTILHNRRLFVNEPILRERSVQYGHIQQMATAQVKIWQIRTWEESVLYSISRALSEERGLAWKRSDGVFLRVPLRILAPGREETYHSYEYLTEVQSEDVIQYIQRHASMFSRRNTSSRRMMGRLQYAMMNS